jgi:hypothetical protein
MNAYVRAASSAAMQGVLTGVWVAAGGMSPGRRRAVRATAVVGLSAAATLADWWFDRQAAEREAWATDDEIAEREDEAKPEPREDDGLEDEAPDPEAIGTRQLALLGAAAAVSAAAIAGRRLWEKRWLQRLENSGHPHPHRALGVRLGAMSFAGSLATSLIRRKARP